MTLANVTDYTVRYATPTDSDQIAALLDDASSLVLQYTGQQLVYKGADDIFLDVPELSTWRLFLPQLPVVNVSSVKNDGTLLDATNDYYWRADGSLERRWGNWKYGPRKVEVVYDHGYDPVEPWIVSIVCAAANRSIQPWVAEGVRQESFVDAYSVSYNQPTGGGSTTFLTDAEKTALDGISLSPVF